MLVHIRTQEATLLGGIHRHLEKRVRAALGPSATRVSSVTVGFSDINGPRGGEDTLCRIHVKQADDGESVRGGVAYIAPGGRHLVLVRRGSGRSVSSSSAVRWSIGVAVVVAACIMTQLPVISPVPAAVERAAEAYRTSPSARLITTDELALLERLDDEVPEGAVIVGSPWTGTALAYALADREVVMPHMFTTTTAAENEVLNSLNTATPGSAVCDAVAETGVQYVLDFGTQEIHGAANVFPGLTDLDESAALELVDEQGDARLFRVIGC